MQTLIYHLLGHICGVKVSVVCHSGPISACEAVDGGAGRRPAGHNNLSLTPLCMAKKVLFGLGGELIWLLRCQSIARARG